VGKLTILSRKTGVTELAVDAVWHDAANTALDTVLKPAATSLADRCTAIWSTARTVAGKALGSIKLLERSLGVPGSNYAAGSIATKNLELAKKCFELFWGPVTVTRVADLKERMNYLKKAFMDDFTVRLITPQPVGSTTKASVRVSHKASAVGAGDHTKRIKFFANLVESGKFDDQGINSMAGTLLHEMSHLVLVTVDKVYSAKKCLELDVDERIVNADNYKYYIELFQYRDLNVGLTALSKSSADLSHVAPED
jgi:Lysine-specific metallo-endopeptidase